MTLDEIEKRAHEAQREWRAWKGQQYLAPAGWIPELADTVLALVAEARLARAWFRAYEQLADATDRGGDDSGKRPTPSLREWTGIDCAHDGSPRSLPRVPQKAGGGGVKECITRLHSSATAESPRSVAGYCERADARLAFAELLMEAWPRIARVIAAARSVRYADGGPSCVLEERLDEALGALEEGT